MRDLPRPSGDRLLISGNRQVHALINAQRCARDGSVDIKKNRSIADIAVRACASCGQLRAQEDSRRKLAIRLVEAVSAAGLLVVVLQWVASW
jgi:hypothetical protein